MWVAVARHNLKGVKILIIYFSGLSVNAQLKSRIYFFAHTGLVDHNGIEELIHAHREIGGRLSNLVAYCHDCVYFKSIRNSFTAIDS